MDHRCSGPDLVFGWEECKARKIPLISDALLLQRRKTPWKDADTAAAAAAHTDADARADANREDVPLSSFYFMTVRQPRRQFPWIPLRDQSLLPRRRRRCVGRV